MDLSAPIPTQTRHRVAILVDGDNVPRKNLPMVEKAAMRWGEVTIRRVFGDMGLHKDWAEETGYTATHCTTKAGKNRADMALVVAAMDFAHRGLATAFVIVSDDRDFGPLINHLSEQGFRVEWLGKPKPVDAPPSVVKPPAPVLKPPALSVLDKTLIGVISKEPDAATGVPLVRLGNLMKGGTVKAQTGQATWRAYLNKRPDLFEIIGEAKESRVRLKA